MSARLKVIELAMELGVTSKDVIVALEVMGHKGMRAMSPVLAATAKELRVSIGRHEAMLPMVSGYKSCGLCRRQFLSWTTHMQYSTECRMAVESIADMVASPQWYSERRVAERAADKLRRSTRTMWKAKVAHDKHMAAALLYLRAYQPPTYWCHGCQSEHKGTSTYFPKKVWQAGESSGLKAITQTRTPGHRRQVCEDFIELVTAWTRKIRSLSGGSCAKCCKRAAPVRHPLLCRCTCVGLYHRIAA